MNQEYDIYEEIDRYLNGELSEAELAQFNKKLSANAEFRSLVEAQKTANEVIFYQQMSDLKARMNNDMNQGNNGSSHWGKIIIAAILLSSAALYTYFHYNQSDVVQPQLVVPVKSSPNKKEINTSIDQPVADKHSKVAGSAINKTTQHDKNSIREQTTNEQPLVINQEIKIDPPINTHHEEQVKKSIPSIDKTAKVNCETIKITAEVKVDYGFGNEGEATVVIDQSSLKGGIPPYSYSLDQSDFEKDNQFEGIKDGTYHVRIKDHNNCISELKKEVIVKTPQKEIDEAFVPSQGERWKFPLKDNVTADITIVSKAGSILFTATISNGYPNEWDGRGNTGVELETGNYYFVIKYSAGEIVKGHISIVR